MILGSFVRFIVYILILVMVALLFKEIWKLTIRGKQLQTAEKKSEELEVEEATLQLEKENKRKEEKLKKEKEKLEENE